MGKIAKLITLVAFAAAALPCQVLAGSLDPPGPPTAGTMKTLDHIPPTWSQELQCDATACPRFEVVLGGAGVLDKETGLVWARVPGDGTCEWHHAFEYCYNPNSTVARGGWRLPAIEELQSLADRSRPKPEPALPLGHPFFINSFGSYWSATNYELDPGEAWGMQLSEKGEVRPYAKATALYVWCVRGPALR